jgi:multidrug resistance efflux pump
LLTASFASKTDALPRSMEEAMSTLRKALLATVPLALAGAFWFGHDTHPAAAAAPTISRTAVLVAPARVEPERDPVTLAFETGGRITAVEVDEGQAVQAGQVVARLDDRLAAARVASTRAAVAGALANYQLARRGARSEDLDAAKADLEAAQAAASHRAVEEQRSEKLGAVGAVSSSTVDADAAAAHVAAANVTAAQARYNALVKGTRSEQVAAAAASLDAAKAELQAAEVGSLVTTMSPVPVVSVADLSILEVRAEIDEADVSSIAVGKPAYATADAYGDRKFPVRITQITRELGRKTVRDDDPRARVDTRVLEVIARFDAAPSEPLPLGLRMYVHVER